MFVLHIFIKNILGYIVGTAAKQKRLLDGCNWYGNDTTTRLMGFDWRKIKTYDNLVKNKDFYFFY